MNVCIAIVTCNRVEKLKTAIAACRAQTYAVSQIYVVDNASSDGTAAYLKAEADETLTPICLTANTGGAGGFFVALELAQHSGHDAVLLLDDDGFPSPEMLGKLVATAQERELDICNALVVSESNPEELSFSLEPEGGFGDEQPPVTTVAQAMERADGLVLADMANPFNGTLVRISWLRSFGNIKAEMFLWGDEVEFLKRAFRSKAKVATVCDAIHYHPKFMLVRATTPLLGEMTVPPDHRALHFYRNRAFLTRASFGLVAAMRSGAKEVIGLVLRGRTGMALKATAWWLDGCLDRYRLPPGRAMLLGKLNGQLPIALKAVESAGSNRKAG